MSAASAIVDGIEPGSELWAVIYTLDSWGFSLFETRISVWTILMALAVLAAALLLARLTIKLACWLIGKVQGLDTTQRLLTQKLVSIVVWVLTFLLTIDVLGIDLTAHNAGITHPLGQLKKIGLHPLPVTTRDKKEYLIPNENLMINQVEHWSFSSREVRIRVPLTVAPNADLRLAERLMLEAARGTARVLDTPPAAVWLLELSEVGAKFEIRVWINDPEEGLANVRSDVLKRAWELFQEHGVRLPNRALREVELRDSAALREWLAAAPFRPDSPAT